MALKRGTNLRDVISGTNGNDVLLGLGGNDTLTGKSGNDLMDGGTGADRMTGGKGNDTYIVDNAGDRVIELANQGTDTVKSSISLTIGVNVEHLILAGTKAINGTLSSSAGEIGNSLTGNGAANTLTGGQGHDVLAGGLGADTLNGGIGNDTLLPGAGNGVADVINGGDGFDTVDYRDALGGVKVSLGANVFQGHAAGDFITNVESIVGSRFADDLQSSGIDGSFAFGGGGNDIVRGNDTAVYDRLRGDDGFDTLIGGTNQEDFVLQYDRGMDAISKYRLLSDDHILIDADEFGLSLTVETRTIVNGTEFSSGDFSAGIPGFTFDNRLVYDTTSNILWADKDGSGTAFAAVPIAFISSDGFDPTAADIWLRDL